jgi:MoxR-like ATPase
MAARRTRALTCHVCGPSSSAASASFSGGGAGSPELIPKGFDEDRLLASAWAEEALEWMAQKDALGQDLFLLGSHGPMRRWLALVYCARANREVEYLALTQDTTESDLKQRRELVPGGSAEYFDQGTLQAALHGRVLIVEGLEKAERNVMPVLNNLLENREMALEDGRFLLPQARYAELSPAQREQSKLVPVHPDFRVIALGVPVPPFPGNPLDPPLRSRFQGFRVVRTLATLATLRANQRSGPV